TAVVRCRLQCFRLGADPNRVGSLNATLLPILQETAPWLRPEVELPRKGACLESVFWRQVHAVEFGEPQRAPVPEPRGRVAHHHSTVHHFESESSVGITADAVPELNRFSPVA